MDSPRIPKPSTSSNDSSYLIYFQGFL